MIAVQGGGDSGVVSSIASSATALINEPRMWDLRGAVLGEIRANGVRGCPRSIHNQTQASESLKALCFFLSTYIVDTLFCFVF